MPSADDNGRYWDRWRARDYYDRAYTRTFWIFGLLAILLNSPILGVCAFVAACTASIHARLARIETRLDERVGDEVR